MSKKNMDKKNRFSSKTLAFRLSLQEADELDMMWKISGYRIKQDFIRDCLFNYRIEAKANPHMLISLKKYLHKIDETIVANESDNEVAAETLATLKKMLEILEAF